MWYYFLMWNLNDVKQIEYKSDYSFLIVFDDEMEGRVEEKTADINDWYSNCSCIGVV